MVDVNLRHYRGDLAIDVVAPSGRVFRLKDPQPSDNTDDLAASYPLFISGESANGIWTLRVRDTVASDSGYLDG